MEELRVKCYSIEEDFEDEKVGIIEFVDEEGREFKVPMDISKANEFNVGGNYNIQFTHYPVLDMSK